MANLSERSPLRKRKRRGRLGPGPSRPGLGFLGGWPSPTLAAAALSSSPLASALGCLGGGVRCTPSPLYKGGPWRRRCTTHPRALLLGRLLPPPGAPATPLATSLLPLSLPRGLLKGYVGEGNHHRCTPSCCGVSRSLSKAVYFRISARNGVPRVIMVAVRVRVQRGAARAVPESLLQDLHDLEVSYIVFIVNACVGA
jgi:hypothetical protein